MAAHMKAVRSLAALLLLFVTAGCVDERSFVIIQNQVPETGCTIPGNMTDVYRPKGILDLQGQRGYEFFPLIRNDLLPSSGVDDQPERNLLFLKEFKVSLDLGVTASRSVPPELTDFDVPTSGLLSPGETRSSSVQVIPDLLVPFLTAPKEFRPVVVATVQAVAEHNGEELESTEFVYPIELCNGCLVVKLSSCPGPDDDVTLLPNLCGLPQDEAVSCCDDAARGLVCLASDTAN